MSDKVRYDPRITPEFVFECAKIGNVSVYSSQVSITGRDLKLKDLKVPNCFCVEWVGKENDHVKITFCLVGKSHGA